MKPKKPKFDANRPENCPSLICDGYVRYWGGYRDYTDDYFWRGVSYYKNNDFDAAIEDLNKAFEINPDLEEAKKIVEEIETQQQSGK